MTKFRKLVAIVCLGLMLGVGTPAAFAGPQETPGCGGPQETPGLSGPQETPGKCGPQETPGLAGATDALGQVIADIITYLATNPVA